ncbi:MAG: RNA polymerase sigma factor FliA [Pseudomonadota bacterium]
MSASSEYLKNEQKDQTELVRKHAPLVKRIAYHLVGRLPSSVDVDDLIQAGTIGLLMAGRNYSPDKGANFETYAGIRIRGAMIDELRKSDWTPRSVHRKIREVTEAIAEIENRTGTKARDQDVAEALSITTAEYHEILRDATASKLFSLDQPSDDSGDPLQVEGEEELEPSEMLQEQSRRQRLVALIEDLPEREKLIMSLYYDDELNLREIGEVLGISESRVCQIHGQALVRLRARIEE